MLYQKLTGELSIHLTDWPVIKAEYRDEKLTKQVEIVREVINLARSIRNKNRVKNRQPLSLMKVAFTNKDWNELIEGFGDIIAEEMNVKKVEIFEDISAIASLKYDPNFNEIRSLYPERLPEIIKAVKSGRFELSDNEVKLTIEGAAESFDPDIILITYRTSRERDGADSTNIAGNKDMVVSLDLTITEELKSEGLARDIIRNIQEARKQIGCDIMDRIKISIKGDYPVEWAEHITTETLSSIEKSVAATTTVEIRGDDGESIVISIEK